jgi:hypothetical protein
LGKGVRRLSRRISEEFWKESKAPGTQGQKKGDGENAAAHLRERHDLLYLVCDGLGASPEQARALSEPPVQVLVIHLLAHIANIDLLLPLAKVIELLLTPARRVQISFRVTIVARSASMGNNSPSPLAIPL